MRRIGASIDNAGQTKAEVFYRDFPGLAVLMDHGWIPTFGSGEAMSMQVSVASEGGSGTPAPDLSIEVDDLDAALARNRLVICSHAASEALAPWPPTAQ